MQCSRRDFLKGAAAGLAVAGIPWLLPSAAHARDGIKEGVKGPYTEAQAAMIHKRSIEEAIRQGGERPEEVKARVDRRIRELRADSIR